MQPRRIAFLTCLALAVVLAVSASAFVGTKTEAPKRAWTILLYGAVDNSADDPFVKFTDQVRRAIDDDPGVELLLLIDRSDRHEKRATFLGDDFTGTRLYRVKKGSVERLSYMHPMRVSYLGRLRGRGWSKDWTFERTVWK